MVKNNIDMRRVMVVLVIMVLYIIGNNMVEKKEAVNYPPGCSFITNIDPYNTQTYSNSAGWIAMDTNSDTVKEAYGFFSFGTHSTTLCKCGGTCEQGESFTLMVNNVNTLGEDIYKYTDQFQTVLAVCTASKSQSSIYKLNYGPASGAVLVCPGGGTCNNIADTNTDCVVTLNEVVTYANKWVNNQGVTLPQVISVANVWVNGGSY